MLRGKFFKSIKSINPSLILGFCLAITLVLSIFTYRLINKRHMDRLAQLTDTVTNTLTSRVQRYENSLIHIRSFLKNNPELDRKSFSSYIELLDIEKNYPGIQGLGYTVRVPREKLFHYENSLKKEGFPNFKVWPEHDRKEFFSIHFLEPFDWRNKRAFGFDMFSQAFRHEAMVKARDTAKPSMTDSVVLVQETNQKTQPGFLIYLPLYQGDSIPETVKDRREKLLGFVYAPFRAHDFFAEIFKEDMALQSEINVSIYDGLAINDKYLLYDNNSLFSQVAANSDRQLTKVFHPSDHAWTIVTTFRQSPQISQEIILPWITAVVGLILSLLLFSILRTAQIHARDMENSLTRFNALVENLTEGLIFALPNGDIQLINKVASQIYHFSSDDEIFWKKDNYNQIINFNTLSGKAVNLEDRPIARVIRGEKYANYELEFLHLSSGDKRYISYGGTPIYNRQGELVLVVITVKDITEKKENEIELQKALIARDEFVSISSHELKTPLTSLKLKAQLFRRKFINGKDISKEEIRKFTEDTDHQVSKLNRLVDDMLDVSRIRSGNFSFEKEIISVDELITPIIDQMKPHFLAAGYQEPMVEISGEGMGHWDRLRIEQVINNLLTNAIRYGDKNDVIIKVVTTSTHVRFYVTDHGAGISDEQKERIFNRFERLNEVHETTGLGLGLFLSQKIVIAHHGKIWVESTPKKGSTFIVELPLISED